MLIGYDRVSTTDQDLTLQLDALARKSPNEVAAFETKRDTPRFRRMMTIMMLVWGISLLASSALACVLVFTLSIHDYMLVSPFVGYGSMGALGLWTVWYRRLAQHRAAR